jgi:hypothetical protein
MAHNGRLGHVDLADLTSPTLNLTRQSCQDIQRGQLCPFPLQTASHPVHRIVVLRGEVSPCEEIGRTIEDVADVSLHHNEVVCCVFVSVEQFERECSPLLLNIRREGVPI